ncbi:MAG: hypothetical protein IT303_18445 [Dehalococcoidia bacterium]|nr:hypothetical protein [Dehalococcoidia bacterium]
MAQAIHEEVHADVPHEPGADAHHGHHDDPNAAPMHHDIVERFSGAMVGYMATLGVVAIVAGIVAGLLFAND